jgi:inosine/xanthosine triphosphate pyrophosphatase family protein
MIICRYAELPKEVKNTISHRYRAVDAMRQYFADHASELVPKFAPRS